MKKKIIGIFICTLLIVTMLPLTTMAGDPENPEIEDEASDLFGPLSFAWQPSFIDIEKGWFQDDAENLHITLKVMDLSFKYWRQIYSIHWTYKGTKFSVGSHIVLFGTQKGSFLIEEIGQPRDWISTEIEEHMCESDDTITWVVPKELLGDVHADDILEETYAWTAIRTPFEPVTYVLFLGEIVKDYAEGSNYIIQY